MRDDALALSLPDAATLALRVVTLLGGFAFVAGILLVPERAWAGVFLASFFTLGLGLGSALFLALEEITGAEWSRGFRPITLATASTLPAASVVFFAVLLLGGTTLYGWMHGEGVSGHHVSALKRVWLQAPFFFARSAVYLGVWSLLTVRLVRSLGRGAGSERLAAGFLVVFALSFWLATMDWFMTLEPQWYSTIFGVYHFAGLFLGALAFLTLAVASLRHGDALKGRVTVEHLHDLGKLLFGFSVFWVYIWFSQYMLIWYTNLPEEAIYFLRRLDGAWLTLSVLNVVLNWIVPFVVLMPWAARRSEGVLIWVSAVLLLGRGLDLYLMVYPPLVGSAPAVGVWDLAPALGTLAAFVLLLFRTLGSRSPVPSADGILAQTGRHS